MQVDKRLRPIDPEPTQRNNRCPLGDCSCHADQGRVSCSTYPGLRLGASRLLLRRCQVSVWEVHLLV